MGNSLAHVAPSRHRVLPETSGAMAKANLRKAETRNFQAEIGACVRAARLVLGWSLKEFTAQIERATGQKRDERQIGRWEDGKERPQFDALFAIEPLRGPLVIQLAALSEAIEVQTTIVVRKSAVDAA